METLLLMAAGAALVLVLQYTRRATPCGAEDTDVDRTPCQLPQGHSDCYHWARTSPHSTQEWPNLESDHHR